MIKVIRNRLEGAIIRYGSRVDGMIHLKGAF